MWEGKHVSAKGKKRREKEQEPAGMTASASSICSRVRPLAPALLNRVRAGQVNECISCVLDLNWTAELTKHAFRGNHARVMSRRTVDEGNTILVLGREVTVAQGIRAEAAVLEGAHRVHPRL